MTRSLLPLLSLFLFAIFHATHAQSLTDKIRLNQIGFYPNAPKLAIIVDAPGGPFYVTTSDRSDTIFTGTLSDSQTWSYSGESVRKADFTSLTATGEYVLVVPGLGYSYRFEITPRIYQDVARASLKAFYFQRASASLPSQYAGVWSRSAGHPDTHVLIHPSAATTQRPAGMPISSPGGWYDAGDYNKYAVNSAVSTATLLSLYEDFPAYCDTLRTDIPESNNAIPDILDEVLWSVRWMLTMQDPDDGGVYHKLTNADFDGTVMPNAAITPRYVVQKSTAATLDFAAVMAQASRICGRFPTQLPGLADSCLAAALSAWSWARRHPAVYYNQSHLNRRFSPPITTGEYGDNNVQDEFTWAAAELYVTTKADSFYTATDLFSDQNTYLPSWQQVGTLGFYSLVRFRSQLTLIADTTGLKSRLTGWADWLSSDTSHSAYSVVMGKLPSDFTWGSNSVTANQGIAMIQAYRLTSNISYLRAALANLDYLLGRNATGYSFVTGYGDKTPMFPHHRPSAADGLAAPVPGLLVGGPNPGQNDGCSYPSSLPAMSYLDSYCSYASNEIAINWNASLAYLSGALEALQDSSGFVSAR